MLNNSLVKMLATEACEDSELNYPKIFRAQYIFLDDSLFNLTDLRANMKFLLKNQEVYYLLFDKNIVDFNEINNLRDHYTLRFIYPDFNEKIILSNNFKFLTALGKLLQTEARRSNSIIKKFDVHCNSYNEYFWWLKGNGNFKLNNIISCSDNLNNNINTFKNMYDLSGSNNSRRVYKKRLKI